MGLPKGLIYTADDLPGCSRRRRGRGFAYFDPNGVHIKSKQDRKRFDALAVPPAYAKVWLCPDPRGHLQATGRDDRGRKQYRYHPDYRAYRENWKFDRMGDFGRRLGPIRRAVDRQLADRGPGDKRYVLALVVKLLDSTGLRIGSDNYLQEYGSRGLTTLVSRNVQLTDDAVSRIKFEFTAKGGKRVTRSIARRALASRVRALQELPGQRLFRYQDESGSFRDLTSGEVNDYLAELTDDAFTAKDFRTWAGTREAATALAKSPDAEGTTFKKVWSAAVKTAAQALGNTPAMARKSYIHPALEDEQAWEFFRNYTKLDLKPIDRLSSIEVALVKFLS